MIGKHPKKRGTCAMAHGRTLKIKQCIDRKNETHNPLINV